MFTRVTGGKPPRTAPAGPQLSRGGFGAAAPLWIQPKLTLGAVDDPLERQADQVAERVVARARGPLGISSIGSAAVQRCDEIEDDCSACEGVGGVKRGREDDDPAAAEAFAAAEPFDEADDPFDQAEEEEEEEEAEEEEEDDDDVGERPRKRQQFPGDIEQSREDEKIFRAPAASPGPPAHAAGSAGGAVPAGVESSIRQAQGGGEALPEPVRERMEQSFGVDFGRVRVHADAGSDRLNRSLSARAFTTGPHIFFRQGENRPHTPAGERLLAHELTHVVQQGGATRQRGGVAPRFLAPATRATGGALAQRKFAGPQFVGGVKDNTAYGAHAFATGAVNALTNCGTHNAIRTAGERKNNHKSRPGTPTDFFRYRKDRGKKAKTYFWRNSGLLYDYSTANCAATKMHLINHRLEDSGNTQNVASNIMLGTKISNNPRHLHDVENPVIDSLAHASRANAEYETAMANAQETTDGAGADVLFWQNGDEPHAKVLTQAPVKAYLREGDVAKGVLPAPVDVTKDVEGISLVVDANTPANNPRHLWLFYQVRANYGAFPANVQANIDKETAENNKRKLAHPLRKETEDRIDDFKNGWAAEAFPPDFDCQVDYYSATYEPGNIYLKETENHNMRADLK